MLTMEDMLKAVNPAREGGMMRLSIADCVIGLHLPLFLMRCTRCLLSRQFIAPYIDNSGKESPLTDSSVE